MSTTSTPAQARPGTHGLLAWAADIVRRAATGAGDRASTRRDAAFAFLVRVASAAILYASQIVLARWLGAYDYGVYVYVWTLVLVLGGLSHLGLNMGMIRFLPAYRATGAFGLARGLLLAGRLIPLAVASAIGAAGMGGLWLLGERIDDHYVLPLYLALVCVPMYTLTDVQDGIGRGSRWMATALLPPYVLRPLILLGCLVAAHEAGMATDATTAATAAILATWTAALVQTLLLQRRLAREMPPAPRRYDVRLWLATSLPLLIIGGCEILLQNTDVIVISNVLTPAHAGIYYAAAKTMGLIMFVHFAVGSAVANRFAALRAQGDEEGLRAFIRDAVNWTFWPSLVCAVVVLATGRVLLGLFGSQFVEAYPVMLILSAGYLVRSAVGPSEFLLNMVGEHKRCAGVMAGAATVNIALNLLLVPAYGLTGAATATAISLALAAMASYLVARRRLGLDIAIWSNLPRRTAPSP